MVERGVGTHIAFRNIAVRYGTKTALQDINLEMARHEIFGIIGPANSGKTTLLKCINRTIDFVPGAKVEGEVLIDGENVFAVKNVYDLRRRIGMVFPLPVAPPGWLAFATGVSWMPW
jgi:phosphate transport system ATP-binding protein